MVRQLQGSALCFCFGLVSVLGGAPSRADEPAHVDDSSSSRALASIKHKPGVKPVVTVYQVRSTNPAINVSAATDMFTTALIKSHAFTVAERQQLSAGVAMERQLNAGGITTGSVSTAKIAGADYVLEAAFTESNSNENQRSESVNIGSGTLGTTSKEDSLGMDLRIISVETGLVIDSVNVVKKIDSGSGLQASNLVTGLASIFMKNRPTPPVSGGDVNSTHKDSIDRATRDCIEAAVAELARRVQSD